MLKVLKVYRYKRSGKLVASGLGDGRVIPMNGDLSFSQQDLHRIKRDTELELTPYRLEVEVTTHKKVETFRIVRRWNEDTRPPKSSDPAAPLEQRIDVTPSGELNESERAYIGASSGHIVGFLLIWAAFFLLFKVGDWGWWPSGIALVAGVLVVHRTKSPGDPAKLQEIRAAKERLNRDAERLLQQALRDVHEWAQLDGIGFEHAVGHIFRERGYAVEFTPRTNDQGVDLILSREGRTSIVQCKAYATNVGVAAVRELVGVRASWPDAHEAILVALYDFSSAAKSFAAEHNVKLFSVARDYLKTDHRPN